MTDLMRPQSNDYLQRIDAAIESSDRLKQLLIAARAEVGSAARNDDLSVMLDALQKRTPAAHWLRDPVLASLLPIVLRFQMGEGESDMHGSVVARSLIAPRSQFFRWSRTLAYPTALGLLVLALAIFLAITVVPTFKKMFDEFGLRLPRATQLVIGFSDAIMSHPQWIVFLLVALLLILWLAGRCVGWLLERLQKFPLFGYWFTGSRSNLVAMARWTASLAELLKVGAPKSDAIEFAGIASRKTFFREQSKRIASWLEEGDRPLAKAPIARGFSATALQALDATSSDGSPVGGASISILRRLSEIYLDRVDNRSTGQSEVFGPIAIVLLGVLVGFVVVAMFMPLISLVTSLSS